MANLSRRRLLRRLLLSLPLLLAFSAAQQSQEPQSQERPLQDTGSTFKVKVNLVSVYATVTDEKGAPLTDLKKEDFSLAEDGVAQTISVFEQESERPVSIILAMDASQSVKKDLKVELDSARRFVAATVRPVDRLALYHFADTVKETVPFTNSPQRITQGIRDTRIGSGTAMFDAIYLAGMALNERHGRKVLVLITDGGDTVSSTRYDEALRAVQQSEAIVYSIIVVPIEQDSGRNIGGEHALIQLSNDTGGKYYYADSPSRLDAAFQQISKELRTQYLLGYYPTQRVADSDFRRIKISVKNAGQSLVVHHRTGYYTSKLR
jgi:Ca-activated chloride channel family protein